MNEIMYAELFAALAAPFEDREVKTLSKGGRSFSYVTARTVANRLDDVLGPSNWWDEYMPMEHSVICKLTVRLPDGTTVTKWDAGGNAGMSDDGDDDKSGFSDAFKRAACKFGVLRYLYRDGVPKFVRDMYPEANWEAGGGPPQQGNYSRPPQSQPQRGPAPAQPQRQGGQGGGDFGNLPRSGKALFAWCKQMEEKFQVGVIKYLDAWANGQGFPRKYADWNEDEIKLGVDEVIRKLQSVQPARDDQYEEALAN